MPDDGDMDVISKLHEVDPVFREVVDLLFGDAVDAREMYDISKMSDPSEYHVKSDLARKHKKQAQVGLASNVVGLASGVAALGSAAADPHLRTKVGEEYVKVIRPSRRTKILAGASLGLQTANVAGDLVANRVLNREAKKKVSKQFTEAVEEIIKARRAGQIDTETAMRLATQLAEDVEKRWKIPGGPWMARGPKARAKAAATKVSRMRPSQKALVASQLKAGNAQAAPKGRATLYATSGVAGLGGGAAVGSMVADKQKQKELVGKADDQVDYGFTGEISKMDEDKRLAFGWCSLSTIDGEPVVDLQGDYAPIDEIEKSAYAYVKDSRVGGDMHARDGERPKHTSDLVESFIATPDKLMKMGLSEEVAKSVPTGWWVGFKINDDEQWQMVKDGRRAGFSIHGKGSRVQKALEV